MSLHFRDKGQFFEAHWWKIKSHRTKIISWLHIFLSQHSKPKDGGTISTRYSRKRSISKEFYIQWNLRYEATNNSKKSNTQEMFPQTILEESNRGNDWENDSKGLALFIRRQCRNRTEYKAVWTNKAGLVQPPQNGRSKKGSRLNLLSSSYVETGN